MYTVIVCVNNKKLEYKLYLKCESNIIIRKLGRNFIRKKEFDDYFKAVEYCALLNLVG